MLKINKLSLRHILVWLAVFLFLFSLTAYFQPTEKALVIASREISYMLIIYLVSYFYIFPVHYKNPRHFLIVSGIFILLFSGFYFVIDVYILERPFDRAGQKPPLIFPLIKFIISNSFIHFIVTTIRLMAHTNQLMKNEKMLKEEKLETELKLLKAQINPHFIFNALNNIYSLSYMQSKKAPESILKLSEMLRYVFYDCSKDRVQMGGEIMYIENFTAFQQMKSDFAQNISFKTEAGLSSLEIAPMIFVPFIENAFKYSRIEEDENAFVHISISKGEDEVLFSVDNSFISDNLPMPGSGTGIQNVKHRLDIIYPDKHELKIEKGENIFEVVLRIRF